MGRSRDWTRDQRLVRKVVPNGEGPGGDSDEWPVSVPAVRQLLRTGLELSAEGGTRNVQQGTRATESPLHRWITLERSVGASRWGFFLRAETMHGYFTRQEEYAGRGEARYHDLSHGESFLELVRARFDSPGLYCLDEPEAALSFSAQVALVSTLHDLATSGAQVLCATHSPVLAALPGARIVELGPWGMRDAVWEDLDLVAHWRRYLAEPMRYLRHVLDTE